MKSVPIEHQPKKVRSIVVVIAALVTMVENYFVSSTWNGFSLNSLFINAVFVIFVLSLIDLALRKLGRKCVLTPAEMLIFYAILTVATGSAGHDTVEMLTQTIGYPFWFATPENEWEELFFKDLPRWLMVDDKKVLEGFYKYDEDFYQYRVFMTWLKPLLFWAGFLIVLYICMICIDILFKRQWVENEKLSFPIAQVPLGLMNPRLLLYRDKTFWYGFSGATFLSLVNGLHRLYPVVPGITYGKLDLTEFFSEKPWNAMDVTYIEFLPFIVGLAFFIPVTLSFSTWFFYWFWKLEMVLGSIVGFHYLPWFPGYWTQGMGAVIILFFMFVFWTKGHLYRVFKTVFHVGYGGYPGESKQYTFAIIGVALSMTFLVFFCYYMGMSIWLSTLFLSLFYIVSTVMTRVRAELGPPTHDFPFTPSSFIVNMIGTKRIGSTSLTQLAILKFVDYGHRSSPMPHMLESLYIKDKLQIKDSSIVLIGIILGIFIGTLTGLFGNLDRCYRSIGQTWVGDWAFPELSNWLRYPSGVSYIYVIYFVAGGIAITILVMLSRYFVWWPFHPLGYLLGGEWMLRYLWFSIFIAWLVKWTILKFGGLSAYRRSVPLFLGITMGDAVMLASWKIYGNIFNKWTLDFVYW